MASFLLSLAGSSMSAEPHFTTKYELIFISFTSTCKIKWTRGCGLSGGAYAAGLTYARGGAYAAGLPAPQVWLSPISYAYGFYFGFSGRVRRGGLPSM